MLELSDSVVRPMREQDLPQVLAWRNAPDIRRFMLSQHLISPEEHRAWFERIQREGTRELLVVESSRGPIGFAQFSARNAGGTADWGFYAAPDAPRGSGRLLGTAALRHAFETLDLHKVCGQAFAFNEASIHMHRALGFVQEGVLREQCLLEGRHHDLLCFGLLKREWIPR